MDESAVINWHIFDQLLELDEGDPNFEFTRSILDDFFQQMKESITTFHQLLTERNWFDMAALGHKMKGSSGQIGLDYVKDLCDEIQHYEHFCTKGREEAYFSQILAKLEPAVETGKEILYEKLKT